MLQKTVKFLCQVLFYCKYFIENLRKHLNYEELARKGNAIESRGKKKH